MSVESTNAVFQAYPFQGEPFASGPFRIPKKKGVTLGRPLFFEVTSGDVQRERRRLTNRPKMPSALSASVIDAGSGTAGVTV